MAQSRTPRNRGRTFSWFVLLLAGTWPRFLRQVGVPTQPCPPSLAFPQAPAPGGHTSPVALVLAGGAAAVRAAMCAACVVPARAGTWFRVPAPGGRTTVPVLAGGGDRVGPQVARVVGMASSRYQVQKALRAGTSVCSSGCQFRAPAAALAQLSGRSSSSSTVLPTVS